MTAHLVLYHCILVVIGFFIGTFVVAVFPMKSSAQAVSRSLTVQSLGVILALMLGLAYVHGYIEDKNDLVTAKQPYPYVVEPTALTPLLAHMHGSLVGISNSNESGETLSGVRK